MGANFYCQQNSSQDFYVEYRKLYFCIHAKLTTPPANSGINFLPGCKPGCVETQKYDLKVPLSYKVITESENFILNENRI